MNSIEVQLTVKVDSNFELVFKILELITHSKGVKLSNTELRLLTYFNVYGYNSFTKEEILKLKLLKDRNGLYNILSKLRKINILVQTDKGEVLNKDYKIPEAGKLDISKVSLIIKR